MREPGQSVVLIGAQCRFKAWRCGNGHQLCATAQLLAHGKPLRVIAPQIEHGIVGQVRQQRRLQAAHFADSSALKPLEHRFQYRRHTLAGEAHHLRAFQAIRHRHREQDVLHSRQRVKPLLRVFLRGNQLGQGGREIHALAVDINAQRQAEPADFGARCEFKRRLGNVCHRDRKTSLDFNFEAGHLRVSEHGRPATRPIVVGQAPQRLAQRLDVARVRERWLDPIRQIEQTRHAHFPARLDAHIAQMLRQHFTSGTLLLDRMFESVSLVWHEHSVCPIRIAKQQLHRREHAPLQAGVATPAHRHIKFNQSKSQHRLRDRQRGFAITHRRAGRNRREVWQLAQRVGNECPTVAIIRLKRWQCHQARQRSCTHRGLQWAQSVAHGVDHQRWVERDDRQGGRAVGNARQAGAQTHSRAQRRFHIGPGERDRTGLTQGEWAVKRQRVRRFDGASAYFRLGETGRSHPQALRGERHL